MVNKMHPGQIILFLPCLLPLIAYCVLRAWAEQSRRYFGKMEIYEKLYEKINTTFKPV